MNTEDGRIYGIDIARVVAMFMVVALHVSGVFSGAASANIGGKVVLVATYCCVDLFALISGYVGVKNEFRLSRIILFWLQVVVTGFVSFCLALLTIVIFGNWSPSFSDWVRIFLPVSSCSYWYVTAYFLLSLVAPFLNAGFNSLPARILDKLILILFFVVVIIPSVYSHRPDAFALEGGYSALWLVVCYSVGGWMRIRGVSFLRPWNWFLLAFLFTTVGFFRTCGYTQPHVFLTAVCYLAGFSQLKIRGGGGLKNLSASSFGVYLLHCQPLMFALLCKRFSFLANMNPIFTLVGILLVSTGIYSCATLVENIRIRTFKRLGIKAMIERVCTMS